MPAAENVLCLKLIRSNLPGYENQMKDKQSITKEDFVEFLLNFLKMHNRRTYMHSCRSYLITKLFLRFLGRNNEEIEYISLAALLHDIGKSLVDNKIIEKDGPLTSEEKKTMDMHSLYGYEVIKSGGMFSDIVDIIRDHHERVDGLGYPFGIKGNDISEGAKIVSICEVFDALASKRSYKSAFPLDISLHMIREDKNKRFDSNLVDSFCECFDLNEELIKTILDFNVYALDENDPITLSQMEETIFGNKKFIINRKSA